VALDEGPVGPALPAPGPVRGASAVLGVQSAIWGLVLLVTFFQTSPALAGQYGMAQVLVTVVSLGVLGGFAAGSVCLAVRLARPGGRRARIGAIGLESFMTCFGLAIFVVSLLGGGWSVGAAGLAGLVGAGLSGAAAGGLLGADARGYCGAWVPDEA
jgi:hypothetical protein